MGDKGAAAIAAALDRNPPALTSLDLKSNSVGLVGCRLLGAVLRGRNDVLTGLWVMGNDMEEGVLQVRGRWACIHQVWWQAV